MTSAPFAARIPDGSHKIGPIRLVLDSKTLSVRRAIAAVLTGLAPLHLTEEESALVELILAEILNNVVEHALQDHLIQGRIRIACVPKPDGLHLRVTDTGLPMAGQIIPAAKAKPLTGPVTDLPEGGFGWHLIRDLARDLRYRRRGAMNVLDLRIPVGRR